MKKISFIFFLSFVHLLAYAGNDSYKDAMKAGLEMLGNAQNADEFLAVANQFERISKVAADKWHPVYYAAFARTITATMMREPSLIDEQLDVAETFLNKAANLDHDKSEVATLQGFIHMLRIGVDPGSRGQEYSMMSGESLQKALYLNPNNPRAVYVQAQLTYGTAQFFGSDGREACETNDRAIELFEIQEQASHADPFAPRWGKPFALSFQRQCQN